MTESCVSNSFLFLILKEKEIPLIFATEKVSHNNKNFQKKYFLTYKIDTYIISFYINKRRNIKIQKLEFFVKALNGVYQKCWKTKFFPFKRIIFDQIFGLTRR